MSDTATGKTVHPLHRLEVEDLNMVTSFVLVSGSIKDLAREYGVSYPTMRTRLDGLIERLRGKLGPASCDPMNEYLATLIASGELNPSSARRLRELHRSALDERHDNVEDTR